MTQDDLKFIPHSDMGIGDVAIVNQHNNLIKNKQFSDATNLLDNNDYQKGFRASPFNYMQEKINIIQNYLLTKEKVESNEIYSEIEPSKDKDFWIMPY